MDLLHHLSFPGELFSAQYLFDVKLSPPENVALKNPKNDSSILLPKLPEVGGFLTDDLPRRLPSHIDLNTLEPRRAPKIPPRSNTGYDMLWASVITYIYNISISLFLATKFKKKKKFRPYQKKKFHFIKWNFIYFKLNITYCSPSGYWTSNFTRFERCNIDRRLSSFVGLTWKARAHEVAVVFNFTVSASRTSAAVFLQP